MSIYLRCCSHKFLAIAMGPGLPFRLFIACLVAHFPTPGLGKALYVFPDHLGVGYGPPAVGLTIFVVGQGLDEGYQCFVEPEYQPEPAFFSKNQYIWW